MATIYHNPRCSKSRAALLLLQSQFAEIEVVHYLDTPLSGDDIRKLLNMLDLHPAELIRRGEAVYQSLGLKNFLDEPQALIDAMAENPILIERPIVVIDDQAVIGRPTERVAALIES